MREAGKFGTSRAPIKGGVNLTIESEETKCWCRSLGCGEEEPVDDAHAVSPADFHKRPSLHHWWASSLHERKTLKYPRKSFQRPFFFQNERCIEELGKQACASGKLLVTCHGACPAVLARHKKEVD